MEIFINTSSHPRAEEYNKIAFSELNELLLSDANPEKWLFDEEHLYLDDTNGLISIIPSDNSYYENENITGDSIENVNNFIRQHLSKNSQDVIIYIGNDIFK